jgi:hypothetical protein
MERRIAGVVGARPDLKSGCFGLAFATRVLHAGVVNRRNNTICY